MIFYSHSVKNIVLSTIRSNFHYLFFNQLNFENLECIYKIVYLDIDKKTFFNYIYNLKEKYSFIFYNNTNIGNSISDSYKLCLAKQLDLHYKIIIFLFLYYIIQINQLNVELLYSN